MKTLSIVLLAVCLVSVHAFVKREAETETPKGNFNFDEAVKSIQQSAKDFGSTLSNAFKTENIQKQFSEFVEGANKVFKDLSSATESKKEEIKQ